MDEAYRKLTLEYQALEEVNAKLVYALSVTAERVKFTENRLHKLGQPIFNRGQWATMVVEALRTSSSPQALRVAEALEVEK